MISRLWKLILLPCVLAAASLPGAAQGPASNQPPAWLSRPMSLADAINLALQQNGAILRGNSDLQAQYGVVMQTRAVALPKVQASGNYQDTTEVEQLTLTTPGFGGNPPASFTVPFGQNQTWNANIQLVQTIYQGGELSSSLRTAKLIKEQAIRDHQTVIADALLAVRIAYYDVLSATEQIVVEEASVKLLTQELDDQTRRFQAGTVPRFNVLRAEVELANERPKLIKARNDYRVSKNNLVNQLGYHVPQQVLEDIPVQLSDKLEADEFHVELPVAIATALQQRSELLSLRAQAKAREEGVVGAQSSYKPTLQIFGGYGARNTALSSDLAHAVRGATGGAQFSWDIFDGLLTQGKIAQARALADGAKVDVDNEARNIELEVRTDYSNFLEAREVLESQKKVVEEAEEALRLATARGEAGTGTQLDVLSAQTSLTQARSTQVTALHDYDVARARLERAIGNNIMQGSAK